MSPLIQLILKLEDGHDLLRLLETSAEHKMEARTGIEPTYAELQSAA